MSCGPRLRGPQHHFRNGIRMMARRLNSFVLSGLLAIALAALGAFGARRLRLQSVADGLGAAFFPWLLIGLFVLLGLCLLAVGIARPPGLAAGIDARDTSGDTLGAVNAEAGDGPMRWSTVAMICGGLIAYALLLVPLGFAPTTAGFVFVTALVLSARPVPAAAFALVTTAALYVIFAIALRVPLP